LGDLFDGHVEVVVKHHYRAMVNRKAPKAPLELVPINDRAQTLACRRLVSRQQVKVGAPTPGTSALHVAGTHEKAVRPGVEALWVSELRQVSPDSQQCLLRGVLGECGVAQDPVRHRVESVADGHDQARERLLVTVLRLLHEIGLHLPPAADDQLFVTVKRYGQKSDANYSIFAYTSARSNHWTVSNDQMTTNDTSSEIDRVVAGYNELVAVLSATRTPEVPASHLSMAQMKLLMLLSGTGEARMSDLSPRLGISLSTLSSLVDRLVDADLARRREDQRDRRNVLVSLTAAGTELLDSFQELGVRHLRELLSQLDEQELNTVNKAVDHLVAAAHRLNPEDPS
jgi:DNA-binding MarR family transcriptional regulator